MNSEQMLQMFLEERGINFSINSSFTRNDNNNGKIWLTELNIQMEGFEKKIFRGFSRNLKISKEIAISKACGILGIAINQNKESKLKIIIAVDYTANLNKFCDQMGLRQPYYSVVPSKNGIGWYVTGFFNFNEHKISVTRKGIHIRDARQEISKYMLDEIDHINNPEKIIIIKKVDSKDGQRQILNRNGKFEYRKSPRRDQSPPREKKISKQINPEEENFFEMDESSEQNSSMNSYIQTEELSEPHYNSPVQTDGDSDFINPDNMVIPQNYFPNVDEFLSGLSLELGL